MERKICLAGLSIQESKDHRLHHAICWLQKPKKPQTPYQRLLATLNVESKRYKKLVEQHARFNPIEHGRKAEEGLRKLYGYMRQVKGQRRNLIFDLVTDQNLAKAD